MDAGCERVLKRIRPTRIVLKALEDVVEEMYDPPSSPEDKFMRRSIENSVFSKSFPSDVDFERLENMLEKVRNSSTQTPWNVVNLNKESQSSPHFGSAMAEKRAMKKVYYNPADRSSFGGVERLRRAVRDVKGKPPSVERRILLNHSGIIVYLLPYVYAKGGQDKP
ncbi:hypothetical protein KOW79_013145 [Hemibagrus wyckioides]|uniref:Uncharacterized protein n=1 Tax=Hemibagrus wyckioides TaxID=337641 RepID=A0A9D3NLI6_9TELE|nr:hypothetical protein KOW79_013145 [Hemibagrus wyckioides]